MFSPYRRNYSLTTAKPVTRRIDRYRVEINWMDGSNIFTKVSAFENRVIAFHSNGNTNVFTNEDAFGILDRAASIPELHYDYKKED